jgi:hypothetical protein
MDTPEIKNQIPAVEPEAKCKCNFLICKCKSKAFKIVTIVVGLLLVVLVSFAGGVAVGLHKAKFSSDWGKNYERNFIGSRAGAGNEHMGPGGFVGSMMRGFEGRDFRNAHGLAGTIISITDNNVMVKDRDGKENTVAVTEKTLIKSRSSDIKIGDLKQDEQIVVMGSPGDNGVLNADLIRVFNNQSNQ